MSAFEKLMGEIANLSADQESMAKALPADDGKDDDKIQAAAEEGGSDGDDGAPGDDGNDGQPMAKSFKLTLEDGTEIEAQDGAELVKSLSDRLDATEISMAKALGSAVDLIKGQAEMIKSLNDKVAKLSGEGRGRKAVVSVVEKTEPGAGTMAKSEPAGMTPETFFVKALAAQKEGRISGTDVALAETCLNRGEPIPAHIIQRVAM